MDRSTPIKLISKTRTQDDYGVWQETETVTEVFAQKDSITRAEFFDAGRNGLNPEFTFKMFFGDYNGEDTLEYNNVRYGIYRTYQGRGDIIELYVEKKGGE